jgi:Tfp pilus assembly protein PilO
MEFKKREKILLIATLCCIVLLTGDRFILTPMGNLWKNRSKEISALKTSIEKGEILIDREKDLEERWRLMCEVCLTKDDSAVENRLLNRVQDWVTESGVALHSLKPRWSEMDEESKRLEIRISATGSLEALSRFLFELERDPSPLRLEDIGISVRDNRSRNMDLSIRFSRLVLKEAKI